MSARDADKEQLAPDVLHTWSLCLSFHILWYAKETHMNITANARITKPVTKNWIVQKIFTNCKYAFALNLSVVHWVYAPPIPVSPSGTGSDEKMMKGSCCAKVCTTLNREGCVYASLLLAGCNSWPRFSGTYNPLCSSNTRFAPLFCWMKVT